MGWQVIFRRYAGEKPHIFVTLTGNVSSLSEKIDDLIKKYKIAETVIGL